MSYETPSADFIRHLGPTNMHGSLMLSRADATQIRKGLAQALGMSDKELGERLAVAMQQHDDAQLTKN